MKIANRKSQIANIDGWLPDMDLNHDKQIQSLLCYRYTIGQRQAALKVGVWAAKSTTPARTAVDSWINGLMDKGASAFRSADIPVRSNVRKPPGEISCVSRLRELLRTRMSALRPCKTDRFSINPSIH